jgi:hypothetical protein
MKPKPELNEVIKKKRLGEPRTIKKFRYNMFIRYFLSGMAKAEIIKRMEINNGIYNEWLKKPEIADTIAEKMQTNLDLDAKKRKRKFEFVTSELYEELTAKIAQGDLSRLGTKTLMQHLVLLNKEVRLDTPGDNIKKVDHNITLQMSEELASRYKKSNSSTFDDREKIIDINQPRQLQEHQEEDVTNGIEYPSSTSRDVVEIKSEPEGKITRKSSSDGDDRESATNRKQDGRRVGSTSSVVGGSDQGGDDLPRMNQLQAKKRF